MPRLRQLPRPVALLLLAGALVGGCGDAPKRAAGEFGMTIRNDTDAAVQVQLCEQWSDDRNCRSFFEDDPPSQDIAAGAQASILVHAETERGKGNAVPGTVRFADPKTGDELGCIPYRITAAPSSHADAPRFAVSQAHACDDSSRVQPRSASAT